MKAMGTKIGAFLWLDSLLEFLENIDVMCEIIAPTLQCKYGLITTTNLYDRSV